MTPMYYGDNGLHEFWQDAERKKMILRNHPEDHWSAHVDGGHVYCDGTIGDALRVVEGKRDFRLMWVENIFGTYVQVKVLCVDRTIAGLRNAVAEFASG